MSLIDGIPANARLKEQVNRLLERDGVHAVLVCAPAGCGGEDAARRIAADYIGNNPDYVLNGVHPDCLELSGSGASGQIKAGELRAVLGEINRGAALGERRVVIVFGGEDLNASSSAILLKTIEEPPQNVLFLMSVHSRDSLAPTIASRCATVYVNALTSGEAAEYVKKNHPAAPAQAVSTALKVFGGRYRLLDEALGDRARLAQAERARDFCSAAALGDRYTVLTALCGERPQVLALLDDALCCLENLAAGGDLSAADLISGVLRLVGDIKSNTPINISAANFCANLQQKASNI